MLRFLCPEAAAPLHIPQTGSPRSCDAVRSFPRALRLARPSHCNQQCSRPLHRVSHSMRKIRSPLAVAVSSACLGLAASASMCAEKETAITIYSSAQPGAIQPEMYRPIPGQGSYNAMAVPGYALVRDDRAMEIKQGRSQI